MTIDLNRSYLIAATDCRSDLPRGIVGTLGAQELQGPDPFASLGFMAVESLDVSDFEKCTHIFDLNTQGVPTALRERYALVYNGGTLEHVFDTWSALRNIHEMLAPNGVVFHVGPMNGWVDHGFYQFSPTFFFDYYHANGYEALAAHLIRSEDNVGTVTVYSYVPGMWDNLPAGTINGRWNFFLVFRKLTASSWDRVPQQSFYSRIYGDTSQIVTSFLQYKPPFKLARGEVIEELRVSRLLPSLSRGENYEWHAHLPNMSGLADGQGSLSPLILYEDGRPLGPPHASHEAIRRQGGGRYSHWGQWLHLSTSDNREPGERIYTYSVPEAMASPPL